MVCQSLAHHHPVCQRIFFRNLHNLFHRELQWLIWSSKTAFPKDRAHVDIVVCIISQFTLYFPVVSPDMLTRYIFWQRISDTCENDEVLSDTQKEPGSCHCCAKGWSCLSPFPIHDFHIDFQVSFILQLLTTVQLITITGTVRDKTFQMFVEVGLFLE